MLALGVALAGAAGAAFRYVVDGGVQVRWRGPFPMGTLVVNLSGSLLLGVLIALTERLDAPGGVRTALGVGFAGGFTTFSTLMFETAALLRDRAWRYAAGNVAANLVGAPVAVLLGLAIGRLG